jgi:hypothetical protein
LGFDKVGEIAQARARGKREVQEPEWDKFILAIFVYSPLGNRRAIGCKLSTATNLFRSISKAAA